MSHRRTIWLILVPLFVVSEFLSQVARADVSGVRNVILVLSDDHRYDFMGFHPGAPEWLETPSMDYMATQGAHIAKAFVTTSLCSPVRASILTGQYMHRHGIVDNQRPEPPGTVFSRSICNERVSPPRWSASGTWATTTTAPGRASITGSASAARASTSTRC
jgi:hypothetical protein